MKSLKYWWLRRKRSIYKKYLCKWLGHCPVTIIEYRRRNHGIKNCYQRKGGHRGHYSYVKGYAVKCSKCGKTLKTFERCW